MDSSGNSRSSANSGGSGTSANPANSSNSGNSGDSAQDTASSEILVRNANGEYTVTIPSVPAPTNDGGNGASAGEHTAEQEAESKLASVANENILG